MISFIALSKRRGAFLLCVVGLLLIVVMLHEIYVPHSFVTSSPGGTLNGFFDERLYTLPAQLVGMLIWGSLSFLVALIWSRTLFASVTFSEVYIVGSLMGSALFPIAYLVFSYLFNIIGSLGSLPTVTLGGVHFAYALFLLMISFLLGIMVLIGREVFRAANHH